MYLLFKTLTFLLQQHLHRGKTSQFKGIPFIQIPVVQHYRCPCILYHEMRSCSLLFADFKQSSAN